MPSAVSISDLRHRYGDHEALCGVDLEIEAGQIFALLGPNGSGKTTLFRLLSTLMPVQSGEIIVAGADCRSDPLEVRRRIGIVFQSASLDKKLSIEENINCQGALYGLGGRQLAARRDALLRSLGLEARRHDRCEKLSGGLRRRVELAKGMLHRPRLLLLDEPSTGLDPAARLDLWQALRRLVAEGTTVVLTTHLLEEAEKADRLALLHEGEKIAEGSPDQLRGELGSGLVTVSTENAAEFEHWVRDTLGLEPQRVHGEVRIRTGRPAELVPRIAEHLGSAARSITVGRPSLEDVFIQRTGHRFDDQPVAEIT